MTDVLARGLRFNVQQLGTGSPSVVFIHGLVIDSLSSWYLTCAPAVAKIRPALLYDLRGHGLSERPRSGYTVDDHADDLCAILEEVGAEVPLTVVGNSFGGRIALAFAMRYPERVESLVVVDAHPTGIGFALRLLETADVEGEEREAMLWEILHDWANEQRRLGAGAAREAAEMYKLVERQRARTRRATRPGLGDLAFDTTLIPDVSGIAAPTAAELGTLTMPSLLIYGEQSDLRRSGEELAAMLPNATFELVPGCSHAVVLLKGDVVAGSLTQWFGALAEAA